MSQDLLTHYGRVRVAYPRLSSNEPESVFTERTTYVNNLSQEVSMRLRSGLLTSFPVLPGSQREMGRDGKFEFVIKREYVFHQAVFHKAANFLSTIDTTHSLELQQLRDIYMKLYAEVTAVQRDIRCRFEYYFTEQELKDLGGRFYHQELDAVFALGLEHTPEHPHSHAGREEAMGNYAQGIQHKYGFVFTVEIIDSLCKYGERYVSICGQIYKISPRKDNNKPDGIYIVSSEPTVGKMSSGEIVVDIYQFGEAEKQLGLYRSYEEALVHGDQALARKRELEELEHANQLMKREMQAEKMEAERLIQERDRQIREMEFEKTMRLRELESRDRELESLRNNQERILEMERLRLKEMYGRKESERKESSEIVKYIPLILTAVGTILMTVKAFKTNS